ncbi:MULTISPECIES: hypothetical protein [Streptomycetaceae]|uniref:Uncharacterized protein n=1 Tax=Streptantibioticus cattleyicolor (strain ATCC 35852 / DSM 46488 / JCM 4925 / NBRC 14057 / NRRL 8057) TaxID=1003195 RepID=F8JR52_STREN|nr:MULTISPECIES: hypothetical protein [Streptomycetaceae]AEW95348.1 hypothetical protein SCATT_29770 [Streptantibioticus cattleyicolor NRRL 8057 = DSM 46488]MYS59925.1 hypothetical protein [Streptomyces sp. SID5468]CCB75692.1 conserved protein of unknown function [Streptantibioticus cattleyicolor NRRL 8057 = DSM 46488]
MLTPKKSPATPGYWCECWTQSPSTGDLPVLLASFDAATATQAVRWIRVAVRTIASALTPDEFDRVWHWLAGGYLTELQELVRTNPCTFEVHHEDTHIQWTARPVLFLALAHREAAKLPPCADQFTVRRPSSE